MKNITNEIMVEHASRIATNQEVIRWLVVLCVVIVIYNIYRALK